MKYAVDSRNEHRENDERHNHATGVPKSASLTPHYAYGSEDNSREPDSGLRNIRRQETRQNSSEQACAKTYTIAQRPQDNGVGCKMKNVGVTKRICKMRDEATSGEESCIIWTGDENRQTYASEQGLYQKVCLCRRFLCDDNILHISFRN